MAFTKALELVRLLEGGKSDNPKDPGGATNAGMTQRTYEALGFLGSVLEASDMVINSAYSKLWASVTIDDPETGGPRPLFELLPEPADAVAFQFFINIRPEEFKRAVQDAVFVPIIDSVLGPRTFYAIRYLNAHELSLTLLATQRQWYTDDASDDFKAGLLNRTDKVFVWMKSQ